MNHSGSRLYSTVRLILLLWFIFITGLLLSGCTSQSQKINFDIFTISSQIPLQAQQIQTQKEIARYTSQSKQEQTPSTSLLIRKTKIQDNNTAEQFIQNNIRQLQRSSSTIQDFKFNINEQQVCKYIYITGSILSYQIEQTSEEDNLYFGQHLFIHKQEAYSISVMSRNQSTRDSLIKSIQRVDCSLDSNTSK
jgi:hypothetical protein